MSSQPGDSALPEWAIAQASAALKIGMSVPDIEQRLVAKGLPPATATAVVTAVLEGRLQASPAAASEPSDGTLLMHRAASVVAACICLALAYAFGGGESVGRTVLWLLLPVACIWWAEMLTDGSPPILVRWAAWVAILLIGGYRVVLLAL